MDTSIALPRSEKRVKKNIVETTINRETEFKRYTLILPVSLLNELQTIADEASIGLVDVFRTSLKIGLMVNKVNKNGGKLILRENNIDREVVLL